MIKRITQRLNRRVSLMPCAEVMREPIELPARVRNPDCIRAPVPADMIVPERY